MKLKDVGPDMAYAAGVAITMSAIAELAVYSEKSGDVEGMSAYAALISGLAWHPRHELAGRGLGIEPGIMGLAIRNGYLSAAADSAIIESASPRLKQLLTNIGHDMASAEAAVWRVYES